MSEAPERTIQRILAGLESGSLDARDLTARQLGSYLGRTTGHVYHHFGSLDGLLFGVAQAGFRALAAHLSQRARRGAGPAEIAAEFVEFCLARPTLYGLMFERHYDWAALRARGLLGATQPDIALWQGLIAELGARGAREPSEAARLFLAGLHGLISLSLSGRANVGALDRADREVALSSARRLARLLFPRAGGRRRSAAPPRTPAAAERRATPKTRERRKTRRPEPRSGKE